MTEIIFSNEIPQANSLEKIEKLVEFASKKIWRYYLIEEELGVVHRQVKYYVSEHRFWDWLKDISLILLQI